MTTLIRTAALIAAITTGSFATVGVFALADGASPTHAHVHQLPRVVVLGEVTRSTAAVTVHQLPRVVVTGRRAVDPATAVAQADRADRGLAAGS